MWTTLEDVAKQWSVRFVAPEARVYACTTLRMLAQLYTQILAC